MTAFAAVSKSGHDTHMVMCGNFSAVSTAEGALAGQGLGRVVQAAKSRQGNVEEYLALLHTIRPDQHGHDDDL